MRIPAPQMRDKITPISITDGPDGPVENELSPVRAGVKFKNRLLLTPAGDEVVSTASVKLDPENAPELGSFAILVPGSTYSRKAKLISASLNTPPREAAFVLAYYE